MPVVRLLGPPVSPDLVVTAPASERGVVSGDEAASEFKDAFLRKLHRELARIPVDDGNQLHLAAVGTIARFVHPGSDALFGHAREATARL
jgi:hypothetical protein